MNIERKGAEIMKKTVLALALLAASAGAFAQSSSEGFTAGSILVRVRAVYLDGANKDNTAIATTAGPHYLNLSAQKKWVIPEVDLSYFFTKNWASELILAIPPKVRINSDVPGPLGGDIGSVRALPPTIFAQYHLDEMHGFKPYVGVGLNYTHFSSVKLIGGATIKRNSFGPALQIGVDYAITKNLYLNLDVKKVWVKTKVTSVPGLGVTNDMMSGTLKIDPTMIGFGIGYRF